MNGRVINVQVKPSRGEMGQIQLLCGSKEKVYESVFPRGPIKNQIHVKNLLLYSLAFALVMITISGRSAIVSISSRNLSPNSLKNVTFMEVLTKRNIGNLISTINRGLDVNCSCCQII